MVVTRRTPVVPRPAPRNQSPQRTQRPPRASFSQDSAAASKDSAAYTEKIITSLSGPSDSNKDPNTGLDSNHSNPGKRSKRSRRHGKNKYQKSDFQAFLDFLTKLLILAFTIYTFSVCPHDTQHQSPICRGLAEYKRIVLDPYIIPPIQAALAHPSVAPHIERAKPCINRAVEITTPILLRTQQEWNLHVVPQWENFIVPEWNKRVVPQWNKYVVPQWDKHVTPRIQLVQSTLEPYYIRVKQEYEQRILPHARVAFYNLQRWQRQAEPYVILAASKTKEGYHALKPYAIPIAKKCGHLLHQSALSLRGQRQKFVDPHVAKMWEKVKELSRGKQVSYEAAPENEPLSPSDTSSMPTILETIGYDITVSSTYDDIPTYTATDVAHPPLSDGETTEGVAHATSPSEPAISPSRPTTTSQPADTSSDGAECLDAESVPAEPATSSTSVSIERPDATSSPILVEATVVLSSSPPPAVDEPPNTPAPVTPSKITVAAASATAPPTHSRGDDEIDFDAFYAELGLDEPLGNAGDSDGHVSGPPSPPAETDEERAERLRLQAAETARKRADIEARQAKWEAELVARMELSTSQLQSRLSQQRMVAAAELPSAAEIRGSIEELVSEAEKYIKGAEIYLKNLKGENRRADEKLTLWDRVADRVSDKFNERLSATEGVINAWSKLLYEKELEEVATVTAQVREVAEKGQLDLGLDYAWLEDVTYDDWQRYHALIGTSEQYASEAISIQNGTHPTVMVDDPLGPILEDLASEVQDVVIGFETRLRRIKRDGERTFNTHSNGAAQKEEDKGSNPEPEAGAKPEASILPVPHDGISEEDATVFPPVIIGRSKEEVLDALGRVEPISDADRHVRGSSVDPEEAVSQLAREVVSGTGMTHTEL